MITNRIREYRLNQSLSQSALAKLVGVRRETIYNLEQGKYNPSLALAWKIAHVFDVSIEDVFTVLMNPSSAEQVHHTGGQNNDN